MTRYVETAARGTRRKALRLTALALGVLLIAAVAYHAGALAALRRSSDAGPTAARLEAARLAASLEPWEPRFGWRVTALEGLALLERGRVDAAYFLLEPLSQVVRGDEVYHTIYQQAVSAKWPLDSRKAHLQHAREQKDGSLRPQDVFK